LFGTGCLTSSYRDSRSRIAGVFVRRYQRYAAIIKQTSVAISASIRVIIKGWWRHRSKMWGISLSCANSTLSQFVKRIFSQLGIHYPVSTSLACNWASLTSTRARIRTNNMPLFADWQHNCVPLKTATNHTTANIQEQSLSST